MRIQFVRRYYPTGCSHLSRTFKFCYPVTPVTEQCDKRYLFTTTTYNIYTHRGHFPRSLVGCADAFVPRIFYILRATGTKRTSNFHASFGLCYSQPSLWKRPERRSLVLAKNLIESWASHFSAWRMLTFRVRRRKMNATGRRKKRRRVASRRYIIRISIPTNYKATRFLQKAAITEPPMISQNEKRVSSCTD